MSIRIVGVGKTEKKTNKQGGNMGGIGGGIRTRGEVVTVRVKLIGQYTYPANLN